MPDAPTREEVMEAHAKRGVALHSLVSNLAAHVAMCETARARCADTGVRGAGYIAQVNLGRRILDDLTSALKGECTRAWDTKNPFWKEGDGG